MSELNHDFMTKVGELIAAREERRRNDVVRTLAAFGERERAAIREATVIGYVNGAWSTGGHKAEIPHDADILVHAIGAALAHPDLYPTLTAASRSDPVEPYELNNGTAEHAGDDGSRLWIERGAGADVCVMTEEGLNVAVPLAKLRAMVAAFETPGAER